MLIRLHIDGPGQNRREPALVLVVSGPQNISQL